MLLAFHRSVKMGKSKEISILLDCNADKTFFAGQNVSGHVHVRTMKRTKIKGRPLLFHQSHDNLLDSYNVLRC